MSYLFKLFIVTSSLFLLSSKSSLNQSSNYNNILLKNNSSFIASSYLNNTSNLKKKLGFRKDFLEKFIVAFSKFWSNTKFIPSSYIINKNLWECFNSITEIPINDPNNTILTFIESTGKYLNDLGNEYYCKSDSKKTKAEYYIFEAYFDNTTNLTNDEDKSLLEFLNQNYFSIGLCLPKKCSNISKELIMKEKQFKDFLFYYLHVSNFSVYEHSNMRDKYNEEYKYGIYIKIIFYSITILKLLIGLIRTIVLTKGYERFYLDELEKKEKKNSISLVSMDSKKSDEESSSDEEKEKILKKTLMDKINEKQEIEKINEIEKSNHALSSKIKENEADIREVYVDYIYGSSSKNESNLYDPFYDNQDKYPLYLKLIKYLDLFDNIKILSKLSNKYYNSCIIKKIYFLKFITMFLAIVFKIMVNQIQKPSKNFLVYKFYQNFSFVIIKLSVFSSVFWIVLDALTAGFKLMSYIKKKIINTYDKNLRFFTLLQFLLLLIPKIFLFLFCFFALHIHSKQLTYSLINDQHLGPFIVYDNINYNYTYTARFANDNFFKGLKYLLPIWLNYLDYFKDIDLNGNKNIAINGSDNLNPSMVPNYTYYEFDRTGFKIPSPFLSNTELFINIYFNELVLFLFMLIITYLSYKIRNKIFDYSILAVNILLYIIPIFNWTKYHFCKNEYEWKNFELIQKCDEYNINFVLGQNFSEKYTHYFINFYYFGFLIGVMMFYYNENVFSKYNCINIINNNNNINNPSHNSSFYNININSNNKLLNVLPFSFCNDFIMALNKIKFWIKRTILLISLFAIILLSFTFHMIQALEKKGKNDRILNEKIKEMKLPSLKIGYIKFIFLYEKNICCFFFFIFLLMLIIYPSKKNIIKFSQLNIFILFERINFSFYCSYSFFVSAAFCVFYVEFKITMINMLLNSLGFFIILIFINIVLVSAFELPLRMLIKTQMNKNTDLYFRKTFTSMELLLPSNRTTVIK